MNKHGIVSAIVFLCVIVCFLCIISPSFIKDLNHFKSERQQAFDETDYKTLKEVENTCRAMIASYETDKINWEIYCNNDEAVYKSMAEQSRIRANKTANTYNEYILKNKYVWKNGVPDDIREKLEVIK